MLNTVLVLTLDNTVLFTTKHSGVIISIGDTFRPRNSAPVDWGLGVGIRVFWELEAHAKC